MARACILTLGVVALLALSGCAERDAAPGAAPAPSGPVARSEPPTPRVVRGAAPGGAAPVEVLGSGSQCGRAEPAPDARWIRDAAELGRLRTRLGQHVVGGTPVAPVVVDFARERVLLLEMGLRPTAGYGLALGQAALVLEGAVARLRVVWVEPAPGALVAQVLTSPCLLLRVAPPAASRLEVVDQSGRVLFELAL